MFKIGLKKHPELKELLELVAGPNAQIRQAALKYLFDGLPTKYSHYDPIFFDKIPYIPAKKPDGTFFLSTPLEVNPRFDGPFFCALTPFRSSPTVNTQPWVFQ